MYLEHRLNYLIEKYNLKTSFSFQRNVESEMLRIWRNIPQSKKIAIWGAGDHGNELIKFLPAKEKNIICFIDKGIGGIGEEIAHYPIYRPDMIKKLEIDLIIISSYRYRKEIAEEIKANYKCEYIDFYHKLEEKGIVLKTPFYYNHPNYLELYEIRNLYEVSQQIGEKEKHLWNLICKYLAIRDFKYAIHFINEYISLGFLKKKELESFLRELELLFTDIKNRLSKRNKGDMTLFLIDSLRNKDVLNGNMPFLNSLAKKSVYFKNAFSTNLFTYMSLFSMFTGKLPIDGKLYNKDMISIEESDLLSTLQEHGYKLYSYVLGKKLFYDSNNLSQIKTSRRLSDIDSIDSGKSSIGAFISNVLWRHVCDLYENEDRPIFSLLHLVGEIHKPHICGFHEERPVIHRGIEEYGVSLPDQKESDFLKQYYECVSYVDKQLEFYMDFLPKNMTKVLFGDHGQVIEDIFTEKNNYFILFGCPDSRIHVPLIIKSPNVGVGTYDNLFSMKNLGSLLLSIMKGSKLEIEKIHNEPYIEVQFEPIFNKALADSIIDISSKKYVFGFKAIRDDKMKYVLYNTGEEDLYILPDEEENCIENNKYLSDLQRLKSYMEIKEFPPFDDEKFKSTVNCR